MKGKGLVRLRSHLLPESRLINLPRGTEMFHFPRCHIIEVFLLGDQRFIAVCLAFAFRGGVRPFPKRPGHPPGASFFSLRLHEYERLHNGSHGVTCLGKPIHGDSNQEKHILSLAVVGIEPTPLGV